MKPTLIIKNIGMLATPVGNAPKSGKLQGTIELIRNSYIVIAGQEILEIGSGELPSRFVKPGAEILDACGALVTPGLIDAHTHLVFGGWREHELADKLRGVSYLDILKRGGGILSTVAATRQATQDELTVKAKSSLYEMLALGTTTCEAKSGYGLTPDDEIKQLNVVKRLKGEQPVELVSTFMGAHAVPSEYMDDKEAYISLIIDAMLPYIAERGLAEYCDVFCETAVFSALEAERILSAAQKLGLGAKIHADEIDAIGGSEVAAELGAVSAEHLIAITERGMDMIAHSGTIAVLLPATSFYLGKDYAPARKMIEKGIPVAVASDFNPGSTPNLSLQLAMNIACYKYLLTPEEALTAVTLNAAASIGRSHIVGSLECGKQADILLWNAPNLDMIFYRYGSNLVRNVIKKGKIIATEGRTL